MANHQRFLFFFVWWMLTNFLSGSLFNVIKICDKRRSLTEKQIKLCNTNFDHMAYIIEGRRIALEECMKQFSGRRWNCTFPEPDVIPFLHPNMPLGTRETAFVHSIIAAATMHSISRACMENKLSSHCSCSQEKKPENLPKTDMWNGCGDNLPYGYQFSKEFVDSKETILKESAFNFGRVLMNLHNNEAGRWAVFEKSKIQCRCHGVSKNCATKTCYRQLSEFKDVGYQLEQLHQSAIRVQLSQSGQKNDTEITKLVEVNSDFDKYTSKDMVYLEDSPSYCKRDLSIGSFGTEGRECSKENIILNQCNHLCCERGHYTKKVFTTENCACKFIWCCEVKCQSCKKEQNIHYCK